MKAKLQTLLVVLMTLGAIPHVAAQVAVFTYQGRLNDSGQCANGHYDFRFTLNTTSPTFNDSSTNMNSTSDVLVTNGLFTVMLDFGPAFALPGTGIQYWLQTQVRTNTPGNTATFVTLAPQTQITPTPYATYAESAGSVGVFTGPIQNNQLSGGGSITVTPGPGLGGGGPVALGGVVTLNNTGVLSVSGPADITASTSGGAVTLGSDATASPMANAIVKRDATGSFSANNSTLDGSLYLPEIAMILAGGNAVMIADDEDNYFAGKGSGNLATTGSQNTIVGTGAFAVNTWGSDNAACGWSALSDNTTGSYNTAVGAQALQFNTTAYYNTASGCEALYANTTGSVNTADGASSLQNNTTGDDDTATGGGALMSNTTGSWNTADGASSLQNNTTGGYNTATGFAALQDNATGNFNTAAGGKALMSNTTAGANTATGYAALQDNTTGGGNTATGYAALGENTIGDYNTATGFAALGENTTGGADTAAGNGALQHNTTGNYNTAAGSLTLPSNTTGSYNLALGYNALSSLMSGSANIGVGINAGGNFNGNETDNIDIGNIGVQGDNQTIRIGNDQTTTVIAGIFNGTLGSPGTEVMVDSSGHLGVRASSAKFKHDIQPMGDVSDVLLKLQPVTFKYNVDRDPRGTPEFGLVAEQVNEVDPDLVVRDGNHQIYSVRYEAVNAMLLNEFLKQHQTVEAQNAVIADLQARLQKMEQIVSDRRAN